MPLERKPVEDQDDPGYPSANEYITGRRAFLGLLGLTALGAGGAYLLKNRANADPIGPDIKLGGAARPPVQPPGGIGRPDPSIPQAEIEGDVTTVELPDTQPTPPSVPRAALEGEPAAPLSNPMGEPPPPDTPPKPAVPEANLKGDVMPVRPQGEIRGRIRTVQPQAQPPGEAPAQPVLPRAHIRGKVRHVQPPAVPKGRTAGKPKPPAQPQANELGFAAPAPKR